MKYESQKIRYLRHHAVPSLNLPAVGQITTNMYAKQYVNKKSSASRSASEVQDKENVPPPETQFLDESISQIEYLDEFDENSFTDRDENRFTVRDESTYLEESTSQMEYLDEFDETSFTERDESRFFEDSTQIEYVDELDENCSDIEDNLKSVKDLRRYISVLLSVIKELEDKNVSQSQYNFFACTNCFIFYF